MRNLLKLVFQRVVAVSFGIALQIIFLIVTATYLRADFFWIRIAMTVLSWVVVIYIISCGVNPSYKIAWIVLILAFPRGGTDDLSALRRQQNFQLRAPEDAVD